MFYPDYHPQGVGEALESIRLAMAEGLVYLGNEVD
jgi:hypothetical protein